MGDKTEKHAGGRVDLAQYYNHTLDEWLHGKPENDLAALPHGIFEADCVKFDTRGVIQLAGRDSLAITGIVYPGAIAAIPVHASGKAVHFLHAAAWNPEDGNLAIGQYTLQYANGERCAVPIVYGENASDWWARPEDVPPTKASVAWEGHNPRTKGMGFSLKLFHYTYQNPLPDQEILTMGFSSAMAHSAPLLVAVTVQ